MKKDPKGRNLMAPVDTLTLGGETYPLRLDLNAFRIAEDVYADEYGKDKNFAEISLELTKGRIGAIMAVFYGGIVSAGAKITWANFAEVFKLTDIPGVKEKMIEMLADALPDAEGGGQDPTSPGNGESAAGSPGTGSGAQA